MDGHLASLVDLLEPSEHVLQVSMARLSSPSPLELVKGVHNHPRLVGVAIREGNQALGGLLAVTEQRLVYLARTLLGRNASRPGNELISIPYEDVTSVRFKRGIGVGDARQLLSLTLFGSKLWVDIGGSEQQFIEIKPLDAAGTMAAAIGARIPSSASR